MKKIKILLLTLLVVGGLCFAQEYESYDDYNNYDYDSNYGNYDDEYLAYDYGYDAAMPYPL